MSICLRGALGGAVLCALAGGAMAGMSEPTVVAEFDLADHPGGNAAPPTYGLRMDGLFGGGVTTFSFTDVSLTVFDTDGVLSINISGEVFGGEVVDNAYVGGGDAYALNFDYRANVSAVDGGWIVDGVSNVDNNGSLTLIGDAARSSGHDLFTFTDNNNNAFLFLPDGHRLGGDDSSWVGRGWLTTNDTGSNEPRTQDWLFTGELVPAPGTAALAAFGLVAAGRRRR